MLARPAAELRRERGTLDRAGHGIGEPRDDGATHQELALTPVDEITTDEPGAA